MCGIIFFTYTRFGCENGTNTKEKPHARVKRERWKGDEYGLVHELFTLTHIRREKTLEHEQGWENKS